MAQIIVAGHLIVDATQRAAYLAGCEEVIVAARVADGCIAFHLSADPIEPDRINLFEHWESAADVEAFRGAGPSGEQQQAIRDALVLQHEIASSEQL